MRKPACSRMMASMSAKPATLSWAMRRPSVFMPRPAWLTMKPGMSMQRTAVWPMRLASAARASPVAGALRRPAITSTTFISGTGLKKWNPATRSGCLHAAAIAVMDSEDVFDARIASGRTMSSSWRNRSRLTSSFSTMASTTRSQSARSVRAAAGTSRATVASASSGVIFPLAASLASVSASAVRAASTACGLASNSLTRNLAWAAICAMPRPMAPVPTIPRVCMENLLRSKEVWLK